MIQCAYLTYRLVVAPLLLIPNARVRLNTHPWCDSRFYNTWLCALGLQLVGIAQLVHAWKYCEVDTLDGYVHIQNVSMLQLMS